MPIRTAIPIVKPAKQQFYELDRAITGFAFDIHNEFGRLLDESIYQTELANRCVAAGLSVSREVRITVTYEAFIKDYFVDIIADAAVPVEAKCVESLNAKHKAQSLNYLFLCDLRHGVLLNFRPAKVIHEFVSTSLTLAQRRNVVVRADRWTPLCRQMDVIKEGFIELLHDWGACLEISLYREALAFMLGGSEAILRPLEIFSNGVAIGSQPVHWINEDIGLSVTAAQNHSQIELHLTRFLHHTRLKALAWINLHHTTIQFVTLTKS